MKRTKSNTIFKKTKKMIPGGVNSPVRSFAAVSSTPFIVKRSKGSLITDVDNNNYIDFIGSWGAMILGHSDNRILKKLNKVSKNGLTYGAPNVAETEIAEFIIKNIPSIDKIRMVNSGTEATMSAARLARGYTKKDIIIKFNGCYHGHGDAFLVEAGSGATTFGKPSSSGVTKGSSKDTISLPYNDKEAVKKVFSKYKNKIACVIIEPIAGNMNFVRSDKSFLTLIRKLCTQNNSLLIFDEVMTGFRVNFRGAQAYYKIKPDLTTFGNVIGGGDWSNHRLIPDIIKSIKKNEFPIIRNPKHIRPWTHVLDTIYGYALAADRSLEEKNSFNSYNFSTNLDKNYNVLKVANVFLKKFNINTIKINNKKEYEEKTILNINSSKSRKVLGWSPLYDVEKAIQITADWYIRNLEMKIKPIDISIDQIKQYIIKINQKEKELLRNII